MIRITKIFTFETAHVLYNYDGKCKNLHGHSYKLLVTVKGAINYDLSDPKNGMVMDFGDLKTKVTETYQIPVAGIMPLSTDMLRLGSQGLFCLQNPDHILTEVYRSIVSHIN